MEKCEICGKSLESSKILNAIKCFGKTLCQDCFFSSVREGNSRPPLFSRKPLKLPVGEKEESYEHMSLRELAAELRDGQFTGYLDVQIPDYGLTQGGRGKALFVLGEIVASSLETGDTVLNRGEALTTMFNYPNIKTHGRIDRYSYGDTDVWLSLERNEKQLFEFGSWDMVQRPVNKLGVLESVQDKNTKAAP